MSEQLEVIMVKSMATQECVRIAGWSGSGADRRHALRALVERSIDDPVNIIVGDWMSEADMTVRGASEVLSHSEPAYAHTFLEALEPALPHIARNQIKVIVNAGASNTEKLHRVVLETIAKQGLELKVAWISGEDVFSKLQDAQRSGYRMFRDIHTGELLAHWQHTPIAAQAHLGGFGISKALSTGADIVLCGHVSNASLTAGAAAWWHSWEQTQLDCLANALVAGHLIKCSTHVTRANLSVFKCLEKIGWDDLGFPIAEINRDGCVTVTKSEGTGGFVSVDTCTAQLLHEIQGPWYFNSDVTAIIDKAQFTQISLDRVALSGITSAPPASTTKVSITAHGGYQAELHWFLVGLDIEAKARMLEAQIRRLLAPHVHRFSLLEFTVNGASPRNPKNQNAATVDFRVLAQALQAEDLALQYFLRPCMDNIMQSCPGATPHFDIRTTVPKPIYEYFVMLIPQSSIEHKAHTPFDTQKEHTIPPPSPDQSRAYSSKPPSSDTSFIASSRALRARGGLTDAAGGWAELPARKGRSILREVFGAWGRTVRGPLGWIVHARSGGEGPDCHIGLWVRHQSEWDWLRSLLSTRKMQELLGEEWTTHTKYNAKTGKHEGKKIERYEFSGLRAVHFLLHDHFARGVSCTHSYDFLGKNVAEFVRSRHVDLPIKFLERGKL